MASPAAKPSAPNLATVLLIKRKIGTASGTKSKLKQAPTITGSHSDEKLAYHQNIPIINPSNITPSQETSDPPKISRKTKQLEVSLLDKKMEEINRKQEAKTNETLGTWKGFDSINYGFNSEPVPEKSTPVPPVQNKQTTSLPSAKKQPSPVNNSEEKTMVETPRQESPVKQQSPNEHPSPIHRQPTSKRVESPIKDQLISESPLKKEEPRKETPKRVESPVEDQPVSESTTKQEEPRKETPKRVESPIKDQPVSESPTKQEEPRRETPLQEQIVEKQPSPSPSPRQENMDKQPSRSPSPQQKPIEKQPSPPIPSPRRSKINSASSLNKAKNLETEEPKPEPSKPQTPMIENDIPISSIVPNIPQIFQKNVQPLEQSPLPTSNVNNFKLFPDIKRSEIKKSKNAHKSIQRSMDRYRFHLW